MVRTRRLKKGEVTYSWARKQETNVLIALDDYKLMIKQFTRYRKHSILVRKAVAHHLGIPLEECRLEEPNKWIFGSFNVCIPVLIRDRREVLIRFPILHKIGDSFQPGNADEKIRCEAGTYAWLQKYCPSIPIPKLYGFAVSTGQSVWSMRYISYDFG